MKLTTLNERISKANEKIEKKTNTIAKKTSLIEKKAATLMKKYGIDYKTFDRYHREGLGLTEEQDNEVYWLACDIDWLEEDIKRGTREIEETKKSLEKYEAQLAGELERESVLIKDVPESMKLMQTQLVEEWDRFDIEKRERIKKIYDEVGYNDFFRKLGYTNADREFMYKTDAQIHDNNVQDARNLIIDLYYRIKDITGEVTDWSNIRCTQGTHGFAVLNGIVAGKEGKATVESILAGGWNIQRLHVRVLVKEWS